LRQHCRYHQKRRNYHFGSKAHREPPDIDGEQPNIHTPSAVLAHGPTSQRSRLAVQVRAIKGVVENQKSESACR
jgi:hypothetical protein